MKKFLFYFLITTFPLGVLTRITVFPSINIYLEDFIVLLILLFSLKEILHYLRNKRNIFLILVYVFSTISVIGILTHVFGLFEVISSLSYLARICCYLLLLIPLMSVKKVNLLKMRLEMLVSGFVFVLFGYIQYMYYPALRNVYYLGWDEHLYRLFSTLLDPNFAGAFIVLIILLYSSYVFDELQRANIKHRIFYTLGYLFLFPALFLTYSRSSYLMGVFSFILFLIFSRQKKLILILGVLCIVGILLLPKNLGGEGVKLLRTGSVLSRTAQYENTLNIIGNNPVIGVGFNSLRFVSGQYGFISQKDLLVSHAGAGVPDSYLFVMATTGIVGFMLFLSFVFLVLRKVWFVVGSKENRMYSICVFSSISGILVGSLFENFLFYSQIMLWLIVLIGILFGSNNSITRIKNKE